MTYPIANDFGYNTILIDRNGKSSMDRFLYVLDVLTDNPDVLIEDVFTAAKPDTNVASATFRYNKNCMLNLNFSSREKKMTLSPADHKHASAEENEAAITLGEIIEKKSQKYEALKKMLNPLSL